MQEQRELQEVLQGLQEKHKVAEEELKALQREKHESDKKREKWKIKLIRKERPKFGGNRG